MPFKDPNSEAAKASSSRRQKKYRKEHPDKVASWPSQTPAAKNDRYYRCVHNITFAEFEAQIVKQGGMCPIGNHPFGPRGKARTSPCQDHDHETNENRMVLCREHNVGLGQFHDSIAEMESGLAYLKQYKKV